MVPIAEILIYRQGRRTGIEDVEWATLEYVDWFNYRRLRGQITPGPVTPPTAASDYRQAVPAIQARSETTELYEARGDSG